MRVAPKKDKRVIANLKRVGSIPGTRGHSDGRPGLIPGHDRYALGHGLDHPHAEILFGSRVHIHSGAFVKALQLLFFDGSQEQDAVSEAKLRDELLQSRRVRSRGSRDDQLGPRVHGAHLRHRPDRQVKPLLRIVPVGQQDIRPADRIPVDSEPTAEPCFDG